MPTSCRQCSVSVSVNHHHVITFASEAHPQAVIIAGVTVHLYLTSHLIIIVISSNC